MNTGISEFTLFGLISVVLGITLLLGIVFELAPTLRRKWILGIALGTGIMAFAVKIVLVLVFSNYAMPISKFFSAARKDSFEYSIQQQNQNIDLSGQGYTWEALPQNPMIPADNPMSKEKIKLGEKLFFDKRLSIDNQVACVSCHILTAEKGGADGLPVSIGIAGQKGSRNAPTVLNAAFQEVLFWDGRASSLEEQAKGPIINPLEMGMPSFLAIEEKLGAIEEYQQLFKQVFTSKPAITIENIAKAIAAYERTLITPNTAYDRFVRGDTSALSKIQLRGMALFESKGCVLCHSSANFSAASYLGNNSMFRMFPAITGSVYEKQYGLVKDRGLNANNSATTTGVWRVPSLRNVSRTAPYFHNGSVNSLEDAVRIMAHVQLGKKISNAATAQHDILWSAEKSQIYMSQDKAITDREVKDIVAFLEALNGK